MQVNNNRHLFLFALAAKKLQHCVLFAWVSGFVFKLTWLTHVENVKNDVITQGVSQDYFTVLVGF